MDKQTNILADSAPNEAFNPYFKSAFTVDNIIFGFDEADLKVLLIRRGEVPFSGEWALPGNFVYQDENLDSAAERVLAELTGLKDVYLEQVRTFGRVDRHPFGRVITVAYYSLIKISDYNIYVSSIATEAAWFSISEVKNLPFDHDEIFSACFNRLKANVKRQPVGFELLPPEFTLTELQHLYEAILEEKLDKRNFRKKILSMNLLIDLERLQEGVAHRPAKLYRFDPDRYKRLMAEEGFHFDVSPSKGKKK
ncbi:MAG: NUDIX domain-containing protein [Bacteroidota bacterium]